MYTVRVRTDTDWQRVSTALRQTNRDFPKELRQRAVRTIRPYVARVKRNVRQIPTHGTKHTGLRRRVALGVKLKARTGGRKGGVVIETYMANPSEVYIPRGLDSREGWRHPVYGNRDHWVRQKTGGSWFREELQGSNREMRRQLVDVINEMLNRIDDSAHG